MTKKGFFLNNNISISDIRDPTHTKDSKDINDKNSQFSY